MKDGERKITFSFDLEDHRPQTPQGLNWPKRFPDNTRKVLDFLDEYEIRGTFFTVGNLARPEKTLIRDVVTRGHEVACHSWDHTPIAEQEPYVFKRHSGDAKAALEDATGTPVVGYRAPIFSLVKKTTWAAELLSELGYHYSSSVLPAKNPLFGFPEAPLTPFKWPCGLTEIPAPIARIGPVTVPFLGGIYFRYLPLALIRKYARTNDERIPLWHYSHPYDFDLDEPYFRINGASHATSVALWFKRGGTFHKLAALAKNGSRSGFDVPFCEQLERVEFSEAPVWRFNGV